MIKYKNNYFFSIWYDIKYGYYTLSYLSSVYHEFKISDIKTKYYAILIPAPPNYKNKYFSKGNLNA